LIDDDDSCVQVLDQLAALRPITTLPGFPAWGFAGA